MSQRHGPLRVTPSLRVTLCLISNTRNQPEPYELTDNVNQLAANLSK